MTVKQISVFLENRAGRLAAVARLLVDHDINIVALSLADASDFGILRLIVDRPEEAAELLRGEQFTIHETEVLAVEVEDCPRGLGRVLDVLQAHSINVEYIYAFSLPHTGAVALVFRLEEPGRAIEVLSEAGVNVLPRVSVLRESADRRPADENTETG